MLARHLKRISKSQLSVLLQSSGKPVSSSLNASLPWASAESALTSGQALRTYFAGGNRGYVQFRRKPLWQSGRNTYWLVGAGALGGLYYVTHQQEIPYTHRKHAIFVSPQTEIQLGVQTFEQVKAQAEAEGKLLPQWHPSVKAVQRVGLRIASVAGDGHGGGYQEHMKNLKWEFAVIDEPDTPNAFVTPGGKVVVFTGLLKLLQMHDDEIAAVLGHEVAHVLARHIGEKLSSAALITLVQIGMYFVLGIGIPAEVYQLALFLPNSRKQESEADEIGVMLAARACFEPKAAAIVFTKLGEKEQQMARVPQWLLTHPLSQARVQAITKNLPKAEQEYELSGCSAPRSFWQGKFS